MKPFEMSIVALQAQTNPTPQAAPEDRSTTFRPVEGGNQMQSGERLLVEAYAAIWLILFIFLGVMFRRQRRLDQRIDALDAALEKARKQKGGDVGG